MAYLLCQLNVASAQPPAKFTPLVFSFGQDVSADGSVVVGTAYAPSSNTYTLAYWTAAQGTVYGPISLKDAAVSPDGTVIAAIAPRQLPGNSEAMRWTPGGTVDLLGELPGGTGSRGFDISRNGQVVVGVSGTFLGMGHQAFRWTESTGMLPLGGLQGVPGRSQANGVSDDGTVIVGEATDASNTFDAFRWTEQTGLVRLPRSGAPGGASAISVTPDGHTIVGYLGSQAGSIEAFRWTEQQGMVPLGDLPGGRVRSIANDVSADGSVIIGVGETFHEDGVGVTTEAFYWNATIGMVNLRNVLINGGATGLDGWTLTEANGVSYDGLTVVGTGIHNGVTEAWVATIPEPSTVGLAVVAGLGLLAVYFRRKPLKVGR